MDLLLKEELWKDIMNGAVVYAGQLFDTTVYRSVFMPQKRNLELVHIPSEETFDLVRAHRDAELYRQGILDETLPVFERCLLIHYLGKIGYKKAAPELREAMMHARESDLRGFALEGLGRLGCREYVPDMIYVLRNDEYVRRDVVRTLGVLKDPRALLPLRETYEEIIYKIHAAEGQGKEWTDYSSEWSNLINVIEAMLRIDGPLAEQSLNEALDDNNIHIHEAAKRGAFFYNRKREKRQ